MACDNALLFVALNAVILDYKFRRQIHEASAHERKARTFVSLNTPVLLGNFLNLDNVCVWLKLSQVEFVCFHLKLSQDFKTGAQKYIYSGSQYLEINLQVKAQKPSVQEGWSQVSQALSRWLPESFSRLFKLYNS